MGDAPLHKFDQKFREKPVLEQTLAPTAVQVKVMTSVRDAILDKSVVSGLESAAAIFRTWDKNDDGFVDQVRG